MKKLLKIASVVIAACALAAIGSGIYVYFTAVKPLQQGIGMFAGNQSEMLSPEPVHFVLAGEDFWIPKYYLLLPVGKEKEPSQLSVYTNWPDLKPQLEERKDRKLAQKNIKQLVSVILNNKSKTPLRKPTVLETWQQTRDRSYGRPFVKTDEVKYGLIRYQTSLPEKTLLFSEMYEEREDGALKSFILCSDDHEVLNPTCSSFRKQINS